MLCYRFKSCSAAYIRFHMTKSSVAQNNFVHKISVIQNLWPRLACQSLLHTGSSCTSHPQQPDCKRFANIAADVCSEIHLKKLPMSEDCMDTVALLLSLHYHPKHLTCVLSTNPRMLKFSTPVWQDTLSRLSAYGFQPNQLLPVIVNCQALLDGSGWDKLDDMLALLRSLDIHGRNKLIVVCKNVHLLELSDTRAVLNSYGNLQQMFTKAEVQSLIPTNPAVLTESCAETNKKIDYVYNEMGIRSDEIVDSRLFQHSLTHIITRHLFAKRTGVYKKPDKHEIAAKEMKRQVVIDTGNPSLKEIVDSSDFTFACKIGNMSLAEYQAFAAMISQEMSEESDLSSSDGELSDSDDEV